MKLYQLARPVTNIRGEPLEPPCPGEQPTQVVTRNIEQILFGSRVFHFPHILFGRFLFAENRGGLEAIFRFASKPADFECTVFLQQRRFVGPLLDFYCRNVCQKSRLSIQTEVALPCVVIVSSTISGLGFGLRLLSLLLAHKVFFQDGSSILWTWYCLVKSLNPVLTLTANSPFVSPTALLYQLPIFSVDMGHPDGFNPSPEAEAEAGNRIMYYVPSNKPARCPVVSGGAYIFQQLRVKGVTLRGYFGVGQHGRPNVAETTRYCLCVRTRNNILCGMDSRKLCGGARARSAHLSPPWSQYLRPRKTVPVHHFSGAATCGRRKTSFRMRQSTEFAIPQIAFGIHLDFSMFWLR